MGRDKVWNDGKYVEVYEAAKSGLSTKKMAFCLGVTVKIFNIWKKKRPHFAEAIQRGKRSYKGKSQDTFREFIYRRLPPHLQDAWDEINACDDRHTKSGVLRIYALMNDYGKRAKQHLYLYALVHSNFSQSEACRKLCLSRKLVESWKINDPDFASLIDEIHQAKKDFFESHLIDLVSNGSESATIFASKTFNRDRGYDLKQTVEHVHDGQIQHTVAMVDLTKLQDFLDVQTQRNLLDAIRKHNQLTVDSLPKSFTTEDE